MKKEKKRFRLEREDKQRISIIISLVFFMIISYFFIDQNVGFPENEIVDYFLGWATHLLTVIFILIIMTSLFMWEEHKREWIIPLWVSFVSAFALSIILKLVVARDRPSESIHFWFDRYSFPSTHAAVTFSAVALLDQEYPKIKWFWIIFGVTIAFSRIWFVEHFLSDVIGGILLGYSIGVGIYYLIKKYSIV
jgi:undecaprenyl-diphosphatase